MKSASLAALPFAALVAFVPTVRAQLEWDRTSQEAHPSLAETNVVARYRFRNAGTKPVSVLEMKSDCECTIGVLARKTYAPGEGDEVVVNYPIVEHSGKVEKSVRVHTDDRKHPWERLSLVVTIPELLTLTPKVVQWQIGETNAPKSMILQVAEGAGVEVAKVVPTTPGVRTQLETVRPRETYRLSVEVDDTSKAVLHVLRIETTPLAGIARTAFAYAIVR